MLTRVKVMRRKFFLFATFFLMGIVSIVHAQNSNLTICRPESHGFVNVIPCLITVKNIDGEKFYLGATINQDGKLKESNRIAGGEKIVLSLPEGIYIIQVITSVSMQEKYTTNSKNIDWVSNKWIFDTKNENTVLYIKPGIMEDGYNGTWIIYE